MRAISYPVGQTIEDPSGNVINQTNKNLLNMNSNLNKNLNYCPQPSLYNKSKQNAYFGNEPLNKEEFFLCKKSAWAPSKISHVIETFIIAVNNDFSDAQMKPLRKIISLREKDEL